MGRFHQGFKRALMKTQKACYNSRLR